MQAVRLHFTASGWFSCGQVGARRSPGDEREDGMILTAMALVLAVPQRHSEPDIVRP